MSMLIGCPGEDDITPGLLLKITLMVMISKVTLIVMIASRSGVSTADLGERKIEQFMSCKVADDEKRKQYSIKMKCNTRIQKK